MNHVDNGREVGVVEAAAIESVKEAVSRGDLDPVLCSGAIEALLLVARQLDDPYFPEINGRLDNVSLPTFLKYCTALRLVPPPVVEDKKTAGKSSALGQIRSRQAGKRAVG